MNKRIFNYTDEVMKDALRTLVLTSRERNGILVEKVLKDDIELTQSIVQKIEDFSEIIMNNGFDAETQKKYSMQELSDAIADLARTVDKDGRSIVKDFSSSSLGYFAQQIINRLITKIEYQELDAWKFVSRELIQDDGTVIYTLVLGEEGPAATARIAEGGEYKTLQLESTEDYIKTSKGKIGVMVSLSEEASKRNGAGLLKALVHAAMQDMSKYKSLEAIRILEANAKQYYDGLSSNQNERPTGRSFANPKQLNGTLLYRDLEKFLLEAQQNAFDIDVIFIHPLAWRVFFKEPTVKEYLKETANVYYMVPKRVPSIAMNQLDKWKNKTTGFVKENKTYKLEVPQLITNAKLNIIVTPLVSFHGVGSTVYKPETRFTGNPVTWYSNVTQPCTDIILCDSSRALTYVHDGRGILSDKVEDNLVDVTRWKFKEYYSFILDKDHGVFAFRNITVTDDIYDPHAQTPQIMYTHKDVFGN